MDDDLQYAKDCLTVYRYLGRAMPKKGVTDAARELHDWVANPDNKQKFLSTILPKAQDTLAKFKDKEDQGEVVQAEKRSIAELRQFLEVELEKAASNSTGLPWE